MGFPSFKKKLGNDTRAEYLLVKIIGVAIGLFVASALMPDALVAIAGANLSGVNTSVVTIFQVLLPILATIGIALLFIWRGD